MPLKSIAKFAMALVAAAVVVESAAPVSARRESVAAGCERPYSASSPWNTPIEARPRYHRAEALHREALAGRLSSDPTQYTYPVYYVSADTPRVEVSLRGWFSNVTAGGRVLRNQRGGTVSLPIPVGAEPAAGSDAQMILVDRVTGDEWGMSNLERGAGGYRAWNAYHYNTSWDGVPPRDASGRPFFPRGAGVPYLAGLVRPCELARGEIDHALAFAYDYPTPSFVWPATKSDGKSRDARDLPEGSRLQLDPSIGADEIRSWGCDGHCFTIARALQRYGMYLIDASGRPKVMLEYQGTAGWQGVDSRTVRPIPLARFRVLESCTVAGTPGDDLLRGTAGDDVVCGFDGDDRVAAGAGDDRVAAGAGSDVAYGGAGADTLLGQAGDDRLFGGDGDDRLGGGSGADVLSGGPGDDALFARDGAGDRVDGGAGVDAASVDRRHDRAAGVERRSP